MNEQEPFISAADRPNVELNPDQPIAQLTVRQFGTLVTGVIQAAKVIDKNLRLEKYGKYEIKELKLEKLEHDLVFEKRGPDIIPDPRQILDDPHFNQFIDLVSHLNKSVQTLNEHVQKLGQRQ